VFLEQQESDQKVHDQSSMQRGPLLLYQIFIFGIVNGNKAK